jgi:preprotein translocase subunit SecY
MKKNNNINLNLQKAKSPSLRSRFILSGSLLTLIRVGSFIPVPYIDRTTFLSLLQNETSSTKAVAAVLSTFSGGGNTSFGLLSLGILPYINASIVLQLLTTTIPSLAKLQKEEGEYGRQKITDYTRSLSLFFAIIEAVGVTFSLKSLIFEWSFKTATQISFTFVAGAMIVLWFSELITRDGLGNGSSLLICFNIVSSLPTQIKAFLFSLQNSPNPLSYFSFLMLIFLVTTFGCVYINEATIKIPLVSARQLLKKNRNDDKDYGTTTLPLRINQAGVMPLVLTSYAMVVLASLANLLKNQFGLAQLSFFSSHPSLFFWGGKLFFWSLYAGLIFFFTYFYSTIVLDPKDVAERLKKDSVVIVGILPGKPTRLFLTKTLQRIARINAIFLITNIVGLQIMETVLKINLTSLQGLGFSSQLILVNVLIDTFKRITNFSNEDETKESENNYGENNDYF